MLNEWKVDSDTNQIAAGCGPIEAAKRSKLQWAHIAPNEAILVSCPKSLSSVRSGMRCWQSFAWDCLGIADDHMEANSRRALVVEQILQVGTCSYFGMCAALITHCLVVGRWAWICMHSHR